MQPRAQSSEETSEETVHFKRNEISGSLHFPTSADERLQNFPTHKRKGKEPASDNICKDKKECAVGASTHTINVQ